MSFEPEFLLQAMFEAARKAADPAVCVPPYLPAAPVRKDGKWGRTVVVGFGKAAASMARAVEKAWPDKNHDAPLEGLVVTRYGHDVPCERINVVEAAHPVPDGAGEKAAALILGKVKGLTADDLVLCLISGGGSALLPLPAAGLTLADKQAVNQALLKSGATISEMNCVRKHLSAIKGGRLAAAAAPAQVVSLLISDVPGDDPAVIASGPTVPDPTDFAEARAVLAKYGLVLPPAVARHMEEAKDETPKPGDPVFERIRTIMVATPQMALEAAAKVARAAGVTPVILGDAIEGESREVATVMAAIASQVRRHGQPAGVPCVLLSGGETTVTVRGKGRGGRNTEFLTALAVALDGAEGIWALAADTDGIDGVEKNAGALLTPDSLARALTKGVDAKACLADNDGYSFFQATGGLVTTGPTLTNVNDFRAILIV
jgi:hydroxypyruvate reductase